MAGAAGALLRAGLIAKLGNLRIATFSYLRDRAEQSRHSLDSYLIRVGFYVVAGVFAIAALLVGAAALFHWIGERYGVFTAFGVTVGALAALSVLAAAIAGASGRKPHRQFPSLGSRLRVAMHAGSRGTTPQRDAAQPLRTQPARPRDPIASARNTAASVLRSSPSPRYDRSPSLSPTMQRAGLATAVGLIGWALARRYSQTPRPRART